MELSLASLLEWTKLFIRDPRLAVALVKEAKLPLEVSIMFIVLAGVIWAVLSGTLFWALEISEFVIPVSETEAMVVQVTGPIVLGINAIICGIGLGFCLFKAGALAGGTGSFSDIMAATAVLQFIVAVLFVVQFLAGLILSFAGLILLVLTVFVLFRGLGNVMNEGHSFDDMGKSILTICASFVMLFFVMVAVSVVLAAFGFAPDREIIPLPEDIQL